MEQLQNEINTLDVRIKKIKKQIDMPTTEMEIKQQMTEFLLVSIPKAKLIVLARNK